MNNHAVVNVRNRNDTRPDFYRPRGHGGAIVLVFESVADFTATIMDTRIVENTAVSSGGAVFISFYDSSANNKVVIRNTSFEENKCDQDGGAISVNTFEFANDNVLIVEDSVFHRNQASIGGGAVSINLQVPKIISLLAITVCKIHLYSIVKDNLVPDRAELINNTAIFTHCNFTNNSSPTGGSAVSLVSNARIDQILATTKFIDW